MADETQPETGDEPNVEPTENAEPTPADAPAESAGAEPTPSVPAPVEPTPAEPTPEVAAAADPTPTLDIGSEAGSVPAAFDVTPMVRGGVDRFGVAMGTGRRKTSVARVRIKSGDGKLEINGRALDDYLCRERDRKMVEAPLVATGQHGKVDVWVRVNGGGTTGQTGAIVLGVARALQAMDPSLHEALADGGFMTRDERMVERKKYGLAKARKSFQFSKR